uniref:Uncharacterized protein n=1 Tax=Anopheles arabiensis TaxID=7173 RepID=A0A182IH01_ANOAR
MDNRKQPVCKCVC